MIERLLAAEKAFDAGQLELADRLYAQVAAADPRNAIAMTGQAKVAQRQGDLDAARRHVARALEVDPDDEAAKGLSALLAAPATPVPVAAASADAPPVPAAAAGSRFVGAAPEAAPPRRSLIAAIRRFLGRLVGR